MKKLEEFMDGVCEETEEVRILQTFLDFEKQYKICLTRKIEFYFFIF